MSVGVGVSQKETDGFIAVVLRCSRSNLLLFICYLCSVF